jgi:2,5-diketo-D-gluconate reductase A
VSYTPQRIQESFALFDFELSQEEMGAMAELESGRRLAADSDTADFKR